MSINDFDPKAPATVECPYPFYQAMRTEAPVHKPSGHDFFIVSGYDDIQEVLLQPEVFPLSLRPAIARRPRRSKL